MGHGRADWSRVREGESRVQRTLRFREWLGGQLRKQGRKVPDRVWQQLLDQGFVDELLDGEVGSLTPPDVVRRAQTFLADLRAKKHRARLRARRRSGRLVLAKEEVEEQIDLRECLKAEEIKRAQVLAREMVRYAETRIWTGPGRWANPDRPVITHFRERVLGGRTVDESAAKALLSSFGAAMFELEFFETHGIPVLDHDSELTSGFDWEAPDSRRGLTPRSEVTFRWGGKALVAPLGERARNTDMSDYPFLPVWRGRESSFAICSTSIAGWLNNIASLLAFSCPWQRDDAVMFVLTGASPPVVPIEIGIPNYSKGDSHALLRVELSIHPWLSSDSVLRLYKRLQRIVVGPRNRAPTKASLEFFDFVSRMRHEGRSFREAMETWVHSHPRERRRYPKKDVSALSRFTNQYRDIERQVLRPFGRPGDKEVSL